VNAKDAAALRRMDRKRKKKVSIYRVESVQSRCLASRSNG